MRNYLTYPSFTLPHSPYPSPVTIRLFPGITAAMISVFCAPPVQGVVLEAFGAGNAPNRQDLLQAIRDACDRGVVIVAISQCTKGSVSAAYETGIALVKAGVVPGYDMCEWFMFARYGRFC